MKSTQEQWVIYQLEKNGEITRNQALRNYISRLGAIICDLNKADWHIVGSYVKTKHGKDYKYVVVSKPKGV